MVHIPLVVEDRLPDIDLEQDTVDIDRVVEDDNYQVLDRADLMEDTLDNLADRVADFVDIQDNVDRLVVVDRVVVVVEMLEFQAAFLVVVLEREAVDWVELGCSLVVLLKDLDFETLAVENSLVLVT